MNNEDMSEVVKNLSSMLNSNNIPDNLILLLLRTRKILVLIWILF